MNTSPQTSPDKMLSKLEAPDAVEMLESPESPLALEAADTSLLAAGSSDELQSNNLSSDADFELDTDSASDTDLNAFDSTDPIGSQGVQAQQAYGEEIISTQNIIHRYSRELEELSEKLKHLRESMSNLLDNDNELQELETQAKTVTQDLRNRKQRVKESPEAVQLSMKAKELQEEKKEIQETLSNHLLRYYQLTGSQVIEEEDGTEREMSINARLKGKKRGE